MSWNPFKLIPFIPSIPTPISMGAEDFFLRQQLKDLKEKQDNLISTFKSEQRQTKTWISPVNKTAQIVTSMLQKTSEYVQGIAFSYKNILQMDSVNVSLINAIKKIGIDHDKLINLDIPSKIGGIPSVLIPGVAGIEMIESIVNFIWDSISLPDQIKTVEENINKITRAIEKEKEFRHKLTILRDYLLDIGTKSISVYEHSTGLRFKPMPLSAHSPQELMVLNEQMMKMIEHLDKVNGNAFMIFRVIINLMTNGKVAKVGTTEAQLDYLTRKLYLLPSVSSAFYSEDAVRQFVTNFFEGDLLNVLPIFMQLPPIPNSIQDIVSQTPSQKSTFDLYSSKYDQPSDLDLSEFGAPPSIEPHLNPVRIDIINKYIWLEKEYNLPLEFSCNFVCNAQSDEFLPCFSKTKVQWENLDCDALSWYMSPHRHDITFRTQLFRGWPTVKRSGSGFNAEVGKQYKMTCQIRSNTATYWIDGQEYATTTYDPGTIPPSGYIGFAVFGKADIQVTDISTTVL